MVDRNRIKSVIKAQITYWNNIGDDIKGLEAIQDSFINLRWRLEKKSLEDCLNDMESNIKEL